MEKSNDKSLSNLDNKFLNASKDLENKRNLRNLKYLFIGLFIGIIGLGFGGFNRYTYCFIERQIINKTKANCFRFMITSGEQNPLISSTNFDLQKGTEYFKKGEYKLAKIFFEQAKDADPTDPVPQIFLNNTEARLKGNPLKLAVVVPIDYYEERAKVILEGVVKAQTKFNKKKGKDARLLEIVIVNEGNEDKIAKSVAEKLVNQKDILGIIGNFTSEMSLATLPVYKIKEVPIIYPASTSSKLNSNDSNNVFFRTVPSTTVAASKYTESIKNIYLKRKLTLDNEALIFYDPNSQYSRTIKEEFETDFKKQGGKVKPICLDKPLPNIKSKCDNEINKSPLIIDDIFKDIEQNQKFKVALLFSSVKTNSVAIAIARKNAKLPLNQKIQLFGSLALAEKPTLIRGEKAVDEMFFVNPCNESTENIDWRTVSSFDATQAFIEGISQGKVTRESMLEFLETRNKNSKFGIEERSITNREYCLFQIRNQNFVNIEDK